MTPTHTAPRATGLEPAFLHAAVQDRITNLWAARQVFRSLDAEWTVKRWECEVELRALLRLARAARRRAEAETVVRADPIDLAKRFADWSEAELAYGR